MKLGLIAVLSIGILGCQAGKQEKVELKTQEDKVSYSIGRDIGKNIKGMLQQQAVDVDPDIFVRGIRDAISGEDSLMTEAETKEVMTAFGESHKAKMQAKAEAAGAESRKAGDAFLAENKGKEGVKTLPSGLQYKVIKAGEGKSPAATDTVTVHYRGTLIDGKEFDSSYGRGQPTTFPVNGVIPGWQEALQLMKVGGKWEIYVPSNLAYGERGTRGIPPHSMLIFEIELLGIK